MKIEFIDNPNSNYMGLAMNKSHIRINMANIHNDDELKATLIHEMTHCLLHFGGKHYTHHQKEYQAMLIEYNYCKNHNNSCTQKSLKAFKSHKKALKDENYNINHLRNEAIAIYQKCKKEVKICLKENLIRI